MESPVAGIQNGLCQRCLTIDFDELCQTWVTAEQTFLTELGLIDHLRRSKCRLCRIFASFAVAENELIDEDSDIEDLFELDLERYHLRAFNAHWAFTGVLRRPDFRGANVLAVVPSKSYDSVREYAWEDHSAMMRVVAPNGFLMPNSLADPMIKIHKVKSDTFDMARVRAWMSFCQERHHHACSLSNTLPEPSDLKVLDCRTRQIVPAPHGCQYVALSYVWGVESTAESTSGATEATIAHFPKVIEDSLAVTLALGLHYIWVDRICIAQDDSQDKLLQINQMDLVYAKAVITIVAAAGAGPNTGLPGINGVPRVNQDQIVFGSMLSTLPLGSYTLQRSKWVTRGWTFQERILSTRRIIFTDVQVLFECNEWHSSEALEILDANETHSFTGLDHRFAQTEKGDLPFESPGLEPRDFFSYVSSYSSKSLTHRSDAINAFRGILNAFRDAKTPVNNFWGIPVFFKDEDMGVTDEAARSASTRFAICLFWEQEPSHSGSVRTAKCEFPSWSWAAWEGQVFTYANKSTSVSPHFLTDARVWFKSITSQHLHELNELNEDADFKKSMRGDLGRQYSSVIQIEGWTTCANVLTRLFSSENSLHKKDELLRSKRKDWVYVKLGKDSTQAVYCPLWGRDPSWIYHRDRPLLAFVGLNYRENSRLLSSPSSPSSENEEEDEGASTELALLLEKVDDDHYERVGYFEPNKGWTVNDEGDATDLMNLFEWDGIECVKRRFWLG